MTIRRVAAARQDPLSYADNRLCSSSPAIIWYCIGSRFRFGDTVRWRMGVDRAMGPTFGKRTAPHAPRISLDLTATGMAGAGQYGWSSSNWSGYAVTSSTPGTFHSITGSWVVPRVGSRALRRRRPMGPGALGWLTLTLGRGAPQRVRAGRDTAYSASWIGIDGFHNTSLIQVGTSQNIVRGFPRYYAWWEILPAAETEINPSRYPVQPGDTMQASIAKQVDGTWTIMLDNVTRGWTFNLGGLRYRGPQTSAEWIEEAPMVNGQLSSLANYGTVTFNPGAVNGENPQLAPADGGALHQAGRRVSTPSLPDADTDGFTIAYGAAQPSPPPS